MNLQQCLKLPVPHPHWHLVLSSFVTVVVLFLSFAILLDAQMYLIEVFICILLMANDLTIFSCIHFCHRHIPLVKCLSCVFCPLKKINLFYFWLHWVFLLAACGLSLAVVSKGYTLVVVEASRNGGPA